MKQIILLLMLANLIPGQSQNLILNPSAELPMVSGEIPNWTETIGNSWKSYDNIADFNFTPNSTPDGTFWFYANSNVQIINGIKISELEQTINISADAVAIDSGTKSYFFDGYVRTFEQGLNDQSSVFIQFFDVNDVLLNFFNFGPFSDATSWNNINGILLAPIASRKVKIKLHSILRNGISNDGLYDNLYFGSTPVLSINQNVFSTINIKISPNPSAGIFSIQSEKTIYKANITIADLNGRIVHEGKFEDIDSKVLDLNKLQSGIYILNISNADYNHSQKILKQ